ncbi:MAG: KOW domain-containing RNA-binding protein [Lachnospiraceae bacterium]|nr:KOW domain-containing RNA-binding protein [Lachnospiraceae bacterium]
MNGLLAYSLAGHDKGEVYLIIEETKDFVYVVDGAVRTLGRPKKKNKKHMQIIKKENQRIDISSVTNEEIRHIIKLYLKGIKEVK